MSHFAYMKKLQKEPLITLTIEIDSGRSANINIFEDSNPEQLACTFIKTYRVGQQYFEPLKANIINQMMQYDKMQKQNKENKQQIPTKRIVNKSPVQKREVSPKVVPKSPNKLVIKSPRLNQLCKQKSYDFIPKMEAKPEVKISILENEESVTQLPKSRTSRNISFSEESQFQNQEFNQDPSETSLTSLLKDSDSKLIAKLFSMMQTNNLIDPRNIPYEKFSYQLIVDIRMHLQRLNFQMLDFHTFEKSAKSNAVLLKSAAEFFQL